MHSRHDLNLSYFENKLAEEKKKISQNIESLKAEVNALGVEDEIDDIEDMAELHIDNSTDQTLLQRLETEDSEIDAALARIKAGVYGICEKTGHKIPMDRLLANPLARTDCRRLDAYDSMVLIMKSNQELIDHMIRSGVLRTPCLIEAFEKCDRMMFVPDGPNYDTYGDYPLAIGMGQTISQPTTVAIMLELLNPCAGNKILDIGSGSGWTTALLATAVGENGSVEGVERIPYLVEYGKNSLKRARIQNASIEVAASSVLGKPGHHYDRILVSASADHMPMALLDQLNPKGILVIPILESIWRITKDENGALNGYELPGFRFVPLIISS